MWENVHCTGSYLCPEWLGRRRERFFDELLSWLVSGGGGGGRGEFRLGNPYIYLWVRGPGVVLTQGGFGHHDPAHRHVVLLGSEHLRPLHPHLLRRRRLHRRVIGGGAVGAHAGMFFVVFGRGGGGGAVLDAGKDDLFAAARRYAGCSPFWTSGSRPAKSLKG